MEVLVNLNVEQLYLLKFKMLQLFFRAGRGDEFYENITDMAS